jgi:poly(A) polymerase
LKSQRIIEPREWMTAAPTRAVMAALAAGGAEARFVGGCVRDTLMAAFGGRTEVVRDIDIATDAEPQRVMELLKRAHIKAVPTGIEHGTVTAVVDGKPFEITTLRRDVETFGRRARVAFTDDWAEDAARRDFTINAMFLAADGRVFDPFGGLDDIATGRVRFVGDAKARIEEDVLRLLRYFRFYAHFDRPPPDEAALAACKALAPKLPTLSGERVHAELLKLLAADDPAATLDLMAREGILDHVLPEAENIPRLAALTVIDHQVLLREPDPLLRLAAALAGGADEAMAVAARLRLSNKERERLVAAMSGAPIVPPLAERAARRLLHRLGRARFVDHLLVNWAEARLHEDAHHAEETGEGGTLDDTPWLALYEQARGWTPVTFPIKGEDALKCGVPPGPAVGELIKAVEEWWADEDFRPGRDACLAQLKALIDSSSAAGNDKKGLSRENTE